MILKDTLQFSTRHPDSNEAHWQHVCLDFDGLLCESSGPYAPDHFGPPIAKGFELLRRLIQEGYTVTILTARKSTDLVARYLADKGFPNLVVTNHKPPAQAYVDDRAVHWHEGLSVEEVLKEIKRRPQR